MGACCCLLLPVVNISETVHELPKEIQIGDLSEVREDNGLFRAKTQDSQVTCSGGAICQAPVSQPFSASCRSWKNSRKEYCCKNLEF